MQHFTISAQLNCSCRRPLCPYKELTSLRKTIRSQSNVTLRLASFVIVRAFQGTAPSKISGVLNQRETLNKIMVAQNYIPPLEVINHKRRQM